MGKISKSVSGMIFSSRSMIIEVLKSDTSAGRKRSSQKLEVAAGVLKSLSEH